MASKKVLSITLVVSVMAFALFAMATPEAAATSKVTVTFAVNGITNYSSSVIIIDGTTYPVSDLSWRTFSWDAGTTHTVTAYSSIRNTDSPSKNYTFSSWTNGNGLTANSGTFTVPGSDVTVTANYVLATHFATFSVTGLTNYSGNIITIDGVTYPVSDLNWRTFAWDVGTVHTVAAVTPIKNTDSPQKTYAFQSWSAGSGLSGTSGTITMPNNDISITATYGSPTRIATFAVNGLTYYTSSIIKIDGTTYAVSDLASKIFAWDAGTTHTIEATVSVKNTETPQKGYTFSSWTNGNGLTTSSGTFTMPSSDVTVTANYVQSTVKVSFSTSGLSNLNTDTVLIVDGASYSVYDVPNINVQWDIGSTHTVTAVNSVKGWDGVTHTFSSWTNGNGLTSNSGTFTTPNADVLVTANYGAQSSTQPTSLTVSSTNGTADNSLLISGTLTSGSCGLSGKTIVLTYYDGAAWQSIGQTTTNSNGAYSFTWTVPTGLATGVYPLKASFAGDSNYQASTASGELTFYGVHLQVLPESLGSIVALIACFGGTIVFIKLRARHKPSAI
jgi:Listeria-Bacteroides repeat domain (List_Bact_rpt).